MFINNFVSANIIIMSEMWSSGGKKKKNDWLYIILILLLFCSNGVLSYLWWEDSNQIKVVTIEKENVEKDAEIVRQELIALQAQYEILQTNNKQMQDEINAKKLEIENLQKQLEKHKDNAYIIAKLRKETETLRKIMRHFVHEIDSLNTLHKAALAEKEAVKKELKTEKEKTMQLTKEKESLQETVNLAAMLKAVGLTASGVNTRRDGKKESETSKAKKTDRIKIKFTIAENIIAERGNRTIYARIITPDGKELTQAEDSSHIFRFGKSKGFWATKKNIHYDNTNTDVVMYANPKPGENFINGKYIIEINADGTTIGTTTLELQ